MNSAERFRVEVGSRGLRRKSDKGIGWGGVVGGGSDRETCQRQKCSVIMCLIFLFTTKRTVLKCTMSKV